MRTIPALILAGATLSATARAESSSTDQILAQSLFDQGRQLMREGEYGKACAKFAESQRLDPGGGTILNLAACREKEGKLAAAWTDFKTALSLARRDGREDRARAAQERIDALEPRLPKLTLVVPPRLEGVTLTLDGAAVGGAAWGVPVPVDPGNHKIEATAKGRKSWQTTFAIDVGGSVSIEVPELEASKEPAARGEADAPGAVPQPASEREVTSSRKTVGWVAGGVGLVALGAGGYFGFRALSKKGESDALCPTDTTCTPRGVSLNEQATTAAWLSNVGVGVGIVGLAIGGYLLLSADRSAESARASRFWSADVTPLSGGGRVDIGATW